jgi:very-short-patch-repair endonuclease
MKTEKYINIKHGYQCDVFIPKMKLIIECDGNYWHKYPIGRDIDKIRTRELLNNGFKVLRLWESDINKMDLNKFSCIITNYDY